MLIVAVLAMPFAYTQDLTDALRYSQENISGTARFRAMGGAFGALGGDISAINLNPASSSIFNSSKAAFTFGSNNISNDVSYFGSPRNFSDSEVNLTQGGGVFVFDANGSSKWNKLALAVAYDRNGNFDDNWIAQGINPTTSIAEYFNGFAQGLRLDEISALPGETFTQAYSDIGNVFGFDHQQAFLGFESFILEPDVDTDDNTIYSNNIVGGNYSQRYAIASTGYNGKMAFNFSGQYDEKLNVGVNINAHFLSYERIRTFDESNSDTNSVVSAVGFDDSLLTTGSGVSFQIGTIYKLTNEFRVGLTYDSPTWLRINDETTQFLQTTANINGNTEQIIINPNVVNIFPEYRLRTPGKITGSLAYVFSDKGLISFDYSRKDYTEMSFRPTDDPFFSNQNTAISNIFDVSNTYRLGAEYRHNRFSFRGGYRFEESPYKDNIFGGDLTTYSLGIGYKFGNFALDLAYAQGQRDQSDLLYGEAPTFNESAQLETTLTDVFLTLTFGI